MAKRGPQRQTHCKRGHELTPENVYVGKSGNQCLTCRKMTKKGGARPEGGRRRPNQNWEQVLADMRYVYKTPPPGDGEKPESEGRKKMRTYYAKSPEKFLDRLEQYEERLRSRSGAEVVLDGGSKRAVDEAERLIKKLVGAV